MEENKIYTISDLAEQQFQITTRTIRYDEEIGYCVQGVQREDNGFFQKRTDSFSPYLIKGYTSINRLGRNGEYTRLRIATVDWKISSRTNFCK